MEIILHLGGVCARLPRSPSEPRSPLNPLFRDNKPFPARVCLALNHIGSHKLAHVREVEK